MFGHAVIIRFPLKDLVDLTVQNPQITSEITGEWESTIHQYMHTGAAVELSAGLNF